MFTAYVLFMNRLFTYILLTSIVIACHIETPQRPVSRFKFTPGNGCKAPCTITFISESENGEAIWWDFGDGSDLQSGNPVTHEFTAAKSYQVRLIVKGVEGGSSGFTQTVKIDEAAPIETFSLTGGYNFPTDILSDAKGNIYVSGTGRGKVEFGNGKTLNSISNSDDFFVAKYNSSGQCQWLYTDGSDGEDHANAIALDSSNNVYVTGFTSGRLARAGIIPTGSGFDGFVAKLNGVTGQSEWFKTFGGPLNDQGRSLAFFQAGEGPKIYMTGTVEGDNLNGNIDFNGTTQKAPNGRDGFLIILDRDGNFGDPYMIHGPNIQAPETITVDDHGNAYIAGAFLQTIKFGNTNRELSSVDSVDVFVAKWGLIARNFLWASRAGSSNVDFAYDIELDKTYENIFVTGMHSGNIHEFENLLSSGDENVYLGKWSVGGKAQIARNGFTDGGRDYHGGIARTSTGNIVIAGSFSGAAGRFPMTDASSVGGGGGTDIILTEVEPGGLTRASQFLVKDGGPTEDRVNKICVTNTGYVYVAGWFYNNSTFNKVSLTGDNKERNTFIARYKL